MSKTGLTTIPFTLADDSLAQFDSFVNGKPVTAQSGKRFDVVDPGSGHIWTSCPDSTDVDVNGAVESSYEAFKIYSKWTPRQRAECLSRWHHLIVAARDDLAKILVYETGKPLAEAYGEIDYATTFTWWFIGEAERIQGSTITSAVAGRRGFTIKQPVGVAAALVPWNFPIALTLRKASAALAAGCTMIVKPSPETPVSAISLAHLAIRAGFPPGALNVLTTSLENTPVVAESLCLHPLVKKVTFTGSTRVGKIISGLCARNLKKCTLELGGNCPFIVFDDANLDHALGQLTALKWRHAGQACVSANRVYIQRGIYDKFIADLIQKTSILKIGHGISEGTTLGPVTTERGLDKAEELVQDALTKGAKMVLGTGQRLKSSAGSESPILTGYFMEPTILVDVTDDMLMSREEIFAPVNVDRLWRMFEKLEAGMVGLNTGNNSAAETPFGGIKESGSGKESGKDVAVDEFLITKSGTLTVEEQS
ncbi:Succinate-semialdehyde dehydrogenase [NADP(+)] GabD [Scedosporium apiospermum]|uniref:Succinate-semialdehyde dehydrogenase [NADP(+)] GabD n=1 Tax=Pseudallescheria apiosperma TaxID=563466 RepID=A0A084GC62_PSEDA|nr:Succinate-semialdehyde dehydrogenase [NADP(+)] GabD [Scedosporium apiospermum]KEZ44924.1 Succinate-semialdehyde dehydrogenase [NADP(+)] GabD [Scedosporium apiospermum]